MKKTLLSSVLATLVFVGSASATTVHHVAKKHHPASMTAKVSADSARALALADVPGATVKDMELEREHGKLVYSFDLTVPGKPGVEEVQIDAITAKLVSKKHETPRQERREAAREKREKASSHP